MKKKLMETISLKLRKKCITSTTKTFLLVAILVVAYFTLNIWLSNSELPTIDVTENKIYTLTDESKDAIKKINQDVKIYVYGYAEDDKIVKLLKQYNESNNKITYEIITSENNLNKIKEYALEAGNQAVVLEVGELNKILFSNDFFSYDNTTWEQIDTTENTLTNSILNLTIANKPKVYFLTGHKEISTEYMIGAAVNLQNSLFEYDTLNLLSTGNVPDDSSLIVVMSPQTDLYEQEYTSLEAYINKGGNLLYTSDFKVQSEGEFVNWTKILDLYGVSIETGVVVENDQKKTIQANEYAIMPTIESSDITKSIHADKTVLLEYAQRISMKDDKTLEDLKVEYQNLLTSSEKSIFQKYSNGQFVTDGEPTNQTVGTYITKTIDATDDSTEAKQSKLVVLGASYFITDYPSEAIYYTEKNMVSQYQLNDNIEFFVNVVSGVTDREDTVFIKKDTSSTSFNPTTFERNIVLAITFIFPILIIIIGIIVWNVRKRKR